VQIAGNYENAWVFNLKFALFNFHFAIPCPKASAPPEQAKTNIGGRRIAKRHRHVRRLADQHIRGDVWQRDERDRGQHDTRFEVFELQASVPFGRLTLATRRHPSGFAGE